MAELVEISVDLVIVGAGYAGVSALNAASHRLPQGARVAIVAKESAWGGQWVWQYDYVRLHQPYRSFTAGEREWKLAKPWGYLASKKEILQHFEDIAAACVKEKGLDLIELFNYEAVSHQALDPPHAGSWQGRAVEVSASSVLPGSRLPKMKIVAKLLIEAEGANIQPRPLLDFSASKSVHSLRPVDVLTPEWNVRMTVGDCKDKPIWIIGSGKTALDVMLRLSESVDRERKRIRCIGGRGTWFLNRDLMETEDWWQRNLPGSNTALDYMVEMFERWDGDNTQDVYQAMAKKGWLHSPLPEAESFVIGICSQAEMQAVRDILSPPAEKVVRAHLVDIVSGDDDIPQMKLRRVPDGVTFDFPIEPGSIVINCSDHLMPQPTRPILSHGGLVLSPQSICGFTGPSANLCTHLHYNGLLEPLWPKVPSLPMYAFEEKEKMGISGLMIVLLNMPVLLNALPNGLKYQPRRVRLPLYRLVLAGLRLRTRFAMLSRKHLTLHPERHEHRPKPASSLEAILGGNIGRHMSRL